MISDKPLLTILHSLFSFDYAFAGLWIMSCSAAPAGTIG